MRLLSLVAEHSLCKRKVGGSTPPVGFLVRKKNGRTGSRARVKRITTAYANHYTIRPEMELSLASKRDVLELNQRPIGLQPIALPLS